MRQTIAILAILIATMTMAFASPYRDYGDLITMHIHEAPRNCAAFWTATLAVHPGSDYADRATDEMAKHGFTDADGETLAAWHTIFEQGPAWSLGQWNVVNARCQTFAS